MAVTGGYFNSVNGDRKYNADQMSEYFEGIINEGVCQHIGGGLAVTAGTGLSVVVATGKAFIGQKWLKNDAALTLTISAASESYSRIDAVVIRKNNAVRSCQIAVKVGTPAASPVAPTMTRDSTTYEMALAYVNVAAGATSVTVTDKRSDSAVCGWAAVAQATSGEVDQMLNDMKTGFDGVEYPSPVEMVQGCDEVLQGEIEAIAELKSVNIYDGTLTNGYVDPSTGAYTSGSTTKVTDYLEVSGLKYISSAYNDARNEMFMIAIFDSSKNVIVTPSVGGTGDGNQRSTGYCKLPINSAYVRVTYVNANIHDNNKLYVLDYPSYSPEQLYDKSLVLNDNSLISFNDVSRVKTMLDTSSNNIYNNDLTAGYIKTDTGEYVSGSTTMVTDYLPVLSGKYIVSAYNNVRNEMFIVGYYDNAKNYIVGPGIGGTGDGNQQLTGYCMIPEGVSYVRVVFVNSNTHNDNKLYLLDTVSYDPDVDVLKYLKMDDNTNIPFEYLITKDKLKDQFTTQFSISHSFYKKKIVAMGDSVTNGQTWFNGLESFFGTRPINKGVPGSTVTTVGENGFCTDARVNDIPTDTELLLIMGGINDWANNVEFGTKTLKNTDTDTFYGAINVLIQKLLARIPDATIICMGATFGMYPNRFTDTTGLYNNENMTTIDYGRAFADMCALNGIRSFVIGEECGWNQNNISTYVTNDGAYLHPNATGGAKMAEVICRKIG